MATVDQTAHEVCTLTRLSLNSCSAGRAQADQRHPPRGHPVRLRKLAQRAGRCPDFQAQRRDREAHPPSLIVKAAQAIFGRPLLLRFLSGLDLTKKAPPEESREANESSGELPIAWIVRHAEVSLTAARQNQGKLGLVEGFSREFVGGVDCVAHLVEQLCRVPLVPVGLQL